METSLGGRGQRGAGLAHERVDHVEEPVDFPAGGCGRRAAAELRHPGLQVAVGGAGRDPGQNSQRIDQLDIGLSAFHASAP
ncbi:hypothetical protein KRMM14A1004_38560 [Krasilnikovia sp. MM14-A1004]